MLDAETMLFTPALRIDYNYYDITDVRVHHSLDDGIQVNYIHPYVTARLEYMQVSLVYFHETCMVVSVLNY